MQKVLLIAEKNSLMNKIKEVYLHNKNKVPFEIIDYTAQAGHLIGMINPDEYDESLKTWSMDTLPFRPENYGGWKYAVLPGKADLYNDIKEKILNNNYDFIIHAGDPDREGEYLVNLALEQIAKETGHTIPPVKRFWTNDLTEESVINALNDMKLDTDSFYTNMLNAARLRAKYDYGVGMNMSRACSIRMNEAVPIGRVQTVVLRMIVDRDQEIENFVPHTSYQVACRFTDKLTGLVCEEVEVEQEKSDESKTKLEPITFETKKEAEDFIKTMDKDLCLKERKDSINSKTAPSLYSLTSLQVDASQKLGFSADRTLATAQSLYEKGILSYPRTECEYVSSKLTSDFSQMLEAAADFPALSNFYERAVAGKSQVIANSKYVNDKKLLEEGHYALVPTGKKVDIMSLNNDERSLMELIDRRFMSIFLPPQKQKDTYLLFEETNHGYPIVAKGKEQIEAGWTEIYGMKSENITVPDEWKEGMVVSCSNIETKEKKSVCPKRFNDGSLIAAMKNPVPFMEDRSKRNIIKEARGIGTPATRAAIINNLQKHGYIEFKIDNKKAPQIYSTEKGKFVISNLRGRTVTKVDMTADMEERLHMVETGRMSAEELWTDMDNAIREMVEDVRSCAMVSRKRAVAEKVGICPICGKNILSGKSYYLCENYKSEKDKLGNIITDRCTFVIPKIVKGSELTVADITALLAGKIITKKLTSQKNTKWQQPLVLENGKLKYAEIAVDGVNCPKCGKKLINEGWKYSCEGKKDESCNFSVSKNILTADITEKDLKVLLNGGSIEKTLKKDGKSWKQKLVLLKDGNFEFQKTDNRVADCPFCGKGILEYDKGWGCSGYKEGCKFFLSKSGRSSTMLKDLLNKGKTAPVKMKSKAGKTYTAIFVLDKENKQVKMSFPE